MHKNAVRAIFFFRVYYNVFGELGIESIKLNKLFIIIELSIGAAPTSGVSSSGPVYRITFAKFLWQITCHRGRYSIRVHKNRSRTANVVFIWLASAQCASHTFIVEVAVVRCVACTIQSFRFTPSTSSSWTSSSSLEIKIYPNKLSNSQ